MEEITQIKEFFYVLKRKFYIILLVTIVAAGISVLFNMYILKPVYESNTTLIVSKSAMNADDTITSEQLDVTERLAVTYGKIIKSRAVLNKVISTLALDTSYKNLAKNVNVEVVEGTQLIIITVKYDNPDTAMLIANTIPPIFTEEAMRLTNTNKIEVMDAGIINKNPVSPNTSVNIFVATVIGLFIGTMITLLSEYMNTKIKTQEDVHKYLDIHVLGIIPKDNI